jgi:LacI family transcriptional regulator
MADDPDGGRATLRTIAERAGVHPSTASRVLTGAGRVGAATAARVRAIAEEVGYEPDLVARSLRTRRTFAIGMVIPRLTDIVLSLMVEAASDRARETGFQVVTMSTRDRDAEQGALVEMLLDRRVDGLILATAAMQDPVPDALLRRAVPFVLLNRRSGSHPSVTGDDERGGYLATSHLLAQGHTRVGIVAGPPHVSTAALRLAGFHRAHTDAGLAVDPSLVVHSPFSIEGGEEAGARLLASANRPTALFAVNDFAAIGVMAAARDQRLTIPGDLAVVGYNDVPIAARLPIPLSSVALPLEEMGRTAVDVLLEQLAGNEKRSLILPPALHVRMSSDGAHTR